MLKMKRHYTRHRSSAIVAWLAIPFAVLLLGAGIIGVLHHHKGGAVDASCAICAASVTSATTVPVIAAPTAPELRQGTLLPPAQSRPAHAAVRRASSRAPPTT